MKFSFFILIFILLSCSSKVVEYGRYPSALTKGESCQKVIEGFYVRTFTRSEKNYLAKMLDNAESLSEDELSYLKAKVPYLQASIEKRSGYLSYIKSLNQNEFINEDIEFLEEVLAKAPRDFEDLADHNKRKELIKYLIYDLELKDITRINTQYPINYQHAGRMYPKELLSKTLNEKYPHGVYFDHHGFPNFAPYAIEIVDIEVTGVNRIDFNTAWLASGRDEIIKGYTWHHHQNMRTMMLIPTDLHDAIKHTGGVAFKTIDIKRVRSKLPLGFQYALSRLPLEHFSKRIRAKYPNSVYYKKNGHPSLREYSQMKVEIESTGSKVKDFAQAKKKAKLEELPRGMTWYLEEDYKTMLLVPRELLNELPYTSKW